MRVHTCVTYKVSSRYDSYQQSACSSTRRRRSRRYPRRTSRGRERSTCLRGGRRIETCPWCRTPRWWRRVHRADARARLELAGVAGHRFAHPLPLLQLRQLQQTVNILFLLVRRLPIHVLGLKDDALRRPESGNVLLRRRPKDGVPLPSLT